MSPSDKPPPSIPSSDRWWREPVMWLVVGGPTLVVLACVATLGLALHYPDPVLEERAAGASAAQYLVKQPAQQPAQTARNHAATGGR